MRRNRRPKFSAAQFDSIIGGVKAIYREKIRPLEEQYMIKDFHYPLLSDDDFEAKPMVLLVGSYSTGKVRAPPRWRHRPLAFAIEHCARRRHAELL